MLVYGDREVSLRLNALTQRLRESSQRTRWVDLDACRALLILAGELEQALFDLPSHSLGLARTCLAASTGITDALAREFTQLSGQVHCPARTLERQRQLERLVQQLESVAARWDPELTVKVPEGYEFYALYPEQYVAAALKWAARHVNVSPKAALVVGIRSIGTTLSAVVKASLEGQRWQAIRTTVRPNGHPFNRKLHSDQLRLLRPSSCALVVDEGPGLSGSSMAAVAKALIEVGYSDISFLPGNGNEPGGAASAQVRKTWAEIPRYFVSADELCWQGRSLRAGLLDRSLRIFDKPRKCGSAAIVDVSGGAWRSYAYRAEEGWPAVCPTFERRKFLALHPGRHAVIWRFAGLGSCLTHSKSSSEILFDKWSQLAEKELVPRPLTTWRGFLALPWVEGRRLAMADGLRPSVLNHLGRYIQRASQAPLSTAQHRAAIRRLSDVLYWNTLECLGEEMAALTRPLAEPASEMAPTPTYGDGRMAPQEWIQTRAGSILKTDCAGHEADHTIVGTQSVLWDIAGTIVEWGLNQQASTRLFEGGQIKATRQTQRILTFYQSAYAAFRLGMLSVAAGQCPPLERKRLKRATTFYTRRLRSLLTASGCPDGHSHISRVRCPAAAENQRSSTKY